MVIVLLYIEETEILEKVHCLVELFHCVVFSVGQPCGGVDFGGSQVCCFGTTHEYRANFKCCGPKYYDTRRQKCADFYTLVNI